MPKNPTSESETSKIRRFETGATGGFATTRPTAAMPGGTTGRFLVLLREGATDEGATTIEKRTGKKLTAATKALSTLGIESEQRPEGILFETLGVAVVESPPEEIQGVMAEAAGESSPILHVEPERYVYALAAPTLVPAPLEEEEPVLPAQPSATPFDYLLGYRDAVNHVVARVIDRSGAVEELEGVPVTAALTETQFTWGLQVTRVPSSRFSGKGIRVAVLDTGMDLGHPDFAGRREPIVRRRAAGSGRSWSRHPLHWNVLWPTAAGNSPALRDRLQRGDSRWQGAQQPGQWHRRADPGRN